MALVIADRVKETTTTTGTGTINLAGAVAAFQTFVAGVGTGNTCYYAITSGNNWDKKRCVQDHNPPNLF